MDNLPSENSDGTNLVEFDNTSLSVKQLQSVYNELTGKKEEISKYFSESHNINFNDLEQLNIKIRQICDIHRVIHLNCCVTVYHVNDLKEQFSSFERFSMYNKSSLSPCENVNIEYNLLIEIPQINKPQNYKIVINLLSRVGLYEKEDDGNDFPRRFFRFFGEKTGMVKIEYVDYNVAKNFLVAIEDWHKTVREIKLPTWVTKLKSNSVHFPFFFRLIATIVITTSIYGNVKYFITDTPSFYTLFVGVLTAFVMIYVVGLVSAKAGSLLENAVDFYNPISCLSLNRGDDKALEKYEKSNKKRIGMGVLSFVIAIGINIISMYIAQYIGLK